MNTTKAIKTKARNTYNAIAIVYLFLIISANSSKSFTKESLLSSLDGLLDHLLRNFDTTMRTSIIMKAANIKNNNLPILKRFSYCKDMKKN